MHTLTEKTQILAQAIQDILSVPNVHDPDYEALDIADNEEVDANDMMTYSSYVDFSLEEMPASIIDVPLHFGIGVSHSAALSLKNQVRLIASIKRESVLRGIAEPEVSVDLGMRYIKVKHRLGACESINSFLKLLFSQIARICGAESLNCIDGGGCFIVRVTPIAANELVAL